MKKTFTFLLVLFYLCIIHTSYAQNSISTLQGKLLNENHLPASAATVLLLRFRDSAKIQSTISDNNGQFGFKNINPDKYILQITKIGYTKIYKGPYVIADGKSVTIDSIKLQPELVNLKEVVITNKRKYYDVRPDKTVLNLDRSILATGSSVSGVLSTAPGVKVNNAGDIFLRAGQRAAIFVNGKQVRLEGEDLAAYLQSLQAAEVDQIELIQNPSAKYDATGGGGVINIILKKGKYVGFNGNVTANADYGKFGKAGTTVNGNYRSEKVNIFGGLGYRYVKTEHTINTLRHVNAAETTTFDTHYYNTQSTPSFDYRIGADWMINPKNTIGFLIKGADETSRFDKQTNTFMDGVNDSTINTQSVLKRKRDQVAYNLNYTGAIGHTGQTISADADLTVLNRQANENIISRVMPTQSITPNVPNLKAALPVFNNDTLTNVAPTRIINQSVKIDYTNPLSKTSRLEAGLKTSYVKSTNSQYFDAMANNTSVPVAALTSEFNYTEKRNAAYINYINNGSKFGYNIGFRVEHTTSKASTPISDSNVDRSYIKLFPSVRLSYTIDNSLLTFNYNRRADQPLYENLNAIVSYQDNYNYRMGNAYLKPAYTDYFQLAYNSKHNFKIALYAKSVSNFFDFTYFTQNDITQVLVTTKINLKKVNGYGLNFTIPVQLKNWWNVNFYTDISYSRYQDFSGSLNKGAKDLVFNLDQDFLITKTLSATLHAQYESATFYGIYNYKPVYLVTPGISKQLFNKAGSISLTVSDIFNTNRDRSNVLYNNLDINTYDKKETRIAHLTFVYNFGKRTVKGARKHSVGNNEEQKRMSGGGN